IMIEIPADTPAEVVPMAWLVGVWEGTGVIDYRVGETRFEGEFSHRVSFQHDGRSFLTYSADATYLPTGEALVSETGYWRLAQPADDASPGPVLLPATRQAATRTASDVEALRQTESGGFPLEVVLSHSDGVQE